MNCIKCGRPVENGQLLCAECNRTKVCRRCGRVLNPADIFCPNCGQRYVIPVASPEYYSNEKCAQCGALLPAGARFCEKCGKSVKRITEQRPAAVCARCGAALPAGARFCEKCGMPCGSASAMYAGNVSADAPTKPVVNTDYRSAQVNTAPERVCGICGAKIPAGGVFCEKCGTPALINIKANIKPRTEDTSPALTLAESGRETDNKMPELVLAESGRAVESTPELVLAESGREKETLPELKLAETEKEDAQIPSLVMPGSFKEETPGFELRLDRCEEPAENGEPEIPNETYEPAEEPALDGKAEEELSVTETVMEEPAQAVTEAEITPVAPDTTEDTDAEESLPVTENTEPAEDNITVPELTLGAVPTAQDTAEQGADNAAQAAFDSRDAEAPAENTDAEGRFICAECGAPLTPGKRFCGNCGLRVGDKPSNASAPAVKIIENAVFIPDIPQETPAQQKEETPAKRGLFHRGKK